MLAIDRVNQELNALWDQREKSDARYIALTAEMETMSDAALARA